MNRNLNNEWLTTAELHTIAESHGLLTSTVVAGIRHQHNENLAHSILLQITKEVRFDMWTRGELILDTRT